MRKFLLVVAMTGALLGSATDAAQDASPASKAYEAAMKAMSRQMMAARDIDAAEEFAKKMIEHHAGGVAMSEIVLKHAKDKRIRAMAAKTADMQRKEIKQLQAWLKQHGG